MRVLNLGILAHVDAGKTSLTERLLFDAGFISRLGSVDGGDTQTDTLELERQRGITIKSAVVAFTIGSTKVNLLDTPGHPDFIAEVERALLVLDAAIVVVSAVEGIQAQTRLLVRALRRLGVPFLFFVNKIDRRGADFAAVVEGIGVLSGVRPLAMCFVEHAGTAAVTAIGLDFRAIETRQVLIDVLAEQDEDLLHAYVYRPHDITDLVLRDHLVNQVRRGDVHPVFAGSAREGTGVPALMTAIEQLLSSRDPDANGPVAGQIFKIDRGWGGEKHAYLSLTSGTIGTRDVVALPRGPERVTAIHVFAEGRVEPARLLRAGQVGRISGLAGASIGDVVGQEEADNRTHSFAPPTLETAVVPKRPSDRQLLWSALSQLAEQDPLINLRHDEEREQMFISLYGEVQKEVIATTLEQSFGVAAEFDESTVICVERLLTTGTATEIAFRDTNPFVATIGLRVSPRPVGTGNRFSFEVDSGLMPAGFYRAVETAAHDALKQGMHGWPVIDAQLTMVLAGQVAPISTAADFRHLTPLVLAAALSQAGTVVCEPISRFRVEAPSDVMGALIVLLGRNGAALLSTEVLSNSAILQGTLPTGRLQAVQKRLPSMAGGNGGIEAEFDRYEPLSAPIARTQTGPNPFNRAHYLASLNR